MGRTRRDNVQRFMNPSKKGFSLKERKMDKLFQVEFGGGEKIIGKLLEVEAPETCRQFWGSLPFEGKVLHGAFTGFTMFFFVELKVGKVENPYLCGGKPGDMFLNTYATKGLLEGKPLREEIIVPYSTSGVFWHWAGPLPSNYFAKLADTSAQELYKIGRRLKEKGAETIKISRYDQG